MSKNLIELTDETFSTEMIQTKSPAIVDFTGPDCPPCRLLDPIVERIADTYAGTVKVGVLDVDENPKTAKKFDIDHIPVVVFLSGGEEVHRTTGFRSEKQLTAAIAQELGVQAQ